MGNYVKMADRQRTLALLQLGWSYRRIQRETGARREVPATVRPDNLKAAVVPAFPYDPEVSELYTAFACYWGFVSKTTP